MIFFIYLIIFFYYILNKSYCFIYLVYFAFLIPFFMFIKSCVFNFFFSKLILQQIFIFFLCFFCINPRTKLNQGAILRPPSSRITSPLSIGFSIMLCTNCANSAGSPNLFGNGVAFERKAITLSGRFESNGVLNRPKNIFIYLFIYLKV